MTNDSLISLTKMTLDQQETIDKLSRRFPMLDGPDIDWIAAEEIYVLYLFLYGNDQTLEKIAERGGCGWSETSHMAAEYRKKRGKNE